MKLFIRKRRTHTHREPKWLWWCGHLSTFEGPMCKAGKRAYETREDAYERACHHASIFHGVNLFNS